MLDQCDSINVWSKNNVMLKIMDSQSKLAAASNHAFNKIAGGGRILS